MSIRFIPNDPSAGPSAPGARTQPKRSNRSASRAGFTFEDTIREGTYDEGTPEFLFWQCREAALSTLDTWEAFADPLTFWQGRRKRLPLLQDAGDDLNAYYDRGRFAFFHRRIGSAVFFSGASTDVVAHEVGHGLLDSIRPDLWDAPFLEAGAFHEAFGDCMAILTALGDRETRMKLLDAAPSLRKRNFVESTAENLSDGIRRLRATHNAAEPRHAYNTFKYQIPETLPDDGGPGALINEVHSFGMLFSGCFYDLIAEIFAADRARTEASLLGAARQAASLLVEGAKTAVITPRFFQSVGRAMVLADDHLNDGAHRQHLRNAFGAHGLMLGADAILAPTTVLEGAGTGREKAAALHPPTRRDLANRLGLPADGRVSTDRVHISGQRFTRVVHTHRVPLGAVDRRLRGVTMDTPLPVIIGASGGRPAVMGAMPEPVSTEREVHAFVASLVEHEQIELGGRRTSTARRKTTSSRAEGRGRGAPLSRETHRVVADGRDRQLVRVRFHCSRASTAAG
jgi:hypothetical protein